MLKTSLSDYPKPAFEWRGKKYGLKMGAQNVVAGTNVAENNQSIKELNAHGISCTWASWEFVLKKRKR